MSHDSHVTNIRSYRTDWILLPWSTWHFCKLNLRHESFNMVKQSISLDLFHGLRLERTSGHMIVVKGLSFLKPTLNLRCIFYHHGTMLLSPAQVWGRWAVGPRGSWGLNTPLHAEGMWRRSRHYITAARAGVCSEQESVESACCGNALSQQEPRATECVVVFFLIIILFSEVGGISDLAWPFVSSYIKSWKVPSRRSTWASAP